MTQRRADCPDKSTQHRRVSKISQQTQSQNIQHFRSLLVLFFALVMILSPSTTTTTRRRGHSVAAALSPKVAVLGGTGRLGRATVQELLKNDIPVNCLVRPSSSELSEWPSDKVTVIKGELMDTAGKPSTALKELLTGCTHCVAVYGATRKTKVTDFFDSSVEDSDPTHAKQINYQSMKALVEACKETKCSQILRITGKGEDPTSFFSVLINGLGSFAKGWNYEGEEVLRQQNDVDYTIVRPGIMKEDYPPPPKDDGKPVEPEYLELADNGGDLKVSVVSYQQIAQLLVECILNPQPKRVTVCAMNVKGSPVQPTLKDRVQALKPDSRKFPKSLIEEHKKAVYKAATGAAAITTIIFLGLLKLVFF